MYNSLHDGAFTTYGYFTRHKRILECLDQNPEPNTGTSPLTPISNQRPANGGLTNGEARQNAKALRNQWLTKHSFFSTHFSFKTYFLLF